MIGPEAEKPRSGQGEQFFDSVSVDFFDPAAAVGGIAWITHRPAAASLRANAFLFVDAEAVESIEHAGDASLENWDDVRVGGVHLATRVPLERWSAGVTGERASLQLELTAVTPPAELEDEAIANAAGLGQYEQLFRCEGNVTTPEGTRVVNCLGRRVHSWGTFGWDAIDRWRTLYAASETGRAVSVVAARPAGSEGHREEPQAFEEVRLSTVFTGEGLPAKAGLELIESDDDIPERLGGELICGLRTQVGGHPLTISFFRWSLEGDPAFGCYEMAEK
jgi:hypothetical protein